jgi:hypothetical protein
LGTVEVDFHFPTVTIHKMAKMPFIPDPRYSMDKEKSLEAQRNLHEDVSMTFRKPYPRNMKLDCQDKRCSIRNYFLKNIYLIAFQYLFRL